jgi:hypothetical protein
LTGDSSYICFINNEAICSNVCLKNPNIILNKKVPIRSAFS